MGEVNGNFARRQLFWGASLPVCILKTKRQNPWCSHFWKTGILTGWRMAEEKSLESQVAHLLTEG